MKEIREQLQGILQELELKAKNCNEEIRRGPEGKLYAGKNQGRDYYYHATEAAGGGFVKPVRKAIKADSTLTRALAHKRYMEELQTYLLRDIALIKSVLTRMSSKDPFEIMKELPKAYRNLPPEYFLTRPGGTGTGAWKRADSGIVIPTELITAARQGILTKEQKAEIREIQKEWASQDYEINTKNLEQRNIMTSRGLSVRSLSEGSIIERLYGWDIPFRYDQVIRIGNREVSPDLSFLSITRGVIWWEHCGMTHSDSYVEYHRYKRKLYESIGIVPWENYIETYNEEDGFLDIRMIDAIIENTLLRWLHLD